MSEKILKAQHKLTKNTEESELPICGLAMPISGFGSYTSAHWSEVRSILERAIAAASFAPRAVWESADSDIIHSRIVRNLYGDKIIVCDTSGLNPNVMFELGMRLTFKKPTVIVVDDITKLPFDTSSIEHIEYPSDLHFSKIESFMAKLTNKILSLIDSEKDGSYKPYLDTFGAFTVVQPDQKSIKFDDFVVNKLEEMASQITDIRRDQKALRQLTAAASRGALTGLRTGGHVLPDVILADPTSLSSWSSERESRLAQMWHAGLTASQIAEELGNGVTRNAIIGKAHRLGLDARPPLEENS